MSKVPEVESNLNFDIECFNSLLSFCKNKIRFLALLSSPGWERDVTSARELPHCPLRIYFFAKYAYFITYSYYTRILKYVGVVLAYHESMDHLAEAYAEMRFSPLSAGFFLL